jgi:hypothetical protein
MDHYVSKMRLATVGANASIVAVFMPLLVDQTLLFL